MIPFKGNILSKKFEVIGCAGKMSHAFSPAEIVK